MRTLTALIGTTLLVSLALVTPALADPSIEPGTAGPAVWTWLHDTGPVHQ
jgi:hypothetical protein